MFNDKEHRYRQFARRILTAVIVFSIILFGASASMAKCPLTAPVLNTNPCLDVIVTRTTPLLSFKNSSGGQGPIRYEIQLDRDPTFSSPALKSFFADQQPEGVTDVQVDAANALDDKQVWRWRVRATDSTGSAGPWAYSRFRVDTSSDDGFVSLVRAEIKAVSAASGANPENLVDYSDQGLNTQWRAAPPGPAVQWVNFDLGRQTNVSRIWMLAQFGDPDGWPVDFHWLAGSDGRHWQPVDGGQIEQADTYRFILDIQPTQARFWRLEITRFTGYAPALNEVLFFSPGALPVPDPPAAPYALVVGNQHNGFTFTLLAERIAQVMPDLKTLTIPHWQASMALFNALEPKPIAIVLSGNNADYNNLPMFAYNGEYELVRHAPVPILGICAGNQMLAFAHGYTRVHAMGWSDISAMQTPDQRTRIDIVHPDPLFDTIPQPFTAAEVHGWAIYSLPDAYEVVAASSYIQSIRSRNNLRHGVQFHPEIKVDYNQAEPVLKNFLQLALDRAEKQTP